MVITNKIIVYTCGVVVVAALLFPEDRVSVK